jgi:dihydroflavonol-4-reductase
VTAPIRHPLVVGGTGFLGLNIARALQERGLPVAITRRESSITFVPRKLKLEMVAAALEDEDALARAMTGRDVVFFTAGHYPRYSVDGAAQVAQAVAGVRRALAAARRAGVRRFVYTSSVTTIGPAPAGRPAGADDEWPAPPDSVYFAVKLAMEREVRRAAAAGLPVIILCPSGCLGRYDIKAGTGFFVVALGAGTLPYRVDGPLDVIAVEDVAAAHLAAAERGRVGARYVIAAHAVGAAELIAMAARRLGVEPPAAQLGLGEALDRNRRQEAECARLGRGRPDIPVEFLDMLRFGQRYDAEPARAELGFPTTPLAAVVDQACEWFIRAGYLRPRAGRDSLEA